MTDREFILSLQSQIAAHLGAPVTPVEPPKPVDPPPKPVDPPVGTFPHQSFSLGNPSALNTWRGTPGAVYSTRLPSTHGMISHTRNVEGGAGAKVEWAISKVPGDMEWWKTQTVAYWGSVAHPYGGAFGAESGGLSWSTVEIQGGRPVAKVDGGEWYLNLRVGDSVLDYSWK